jgi:predicted ATPase/DNA-binding SARP family transcriptional activator
VTGSAYRFGVLGPLLVERDGEAVAIASGQQRALLAVLLAARQPISRDRLIDELWGERPPPSAVKALSVILSRLRAQIGDAVVYRAGAYELSVGEYELDADRLSALVAQARTEPQLGRDLLTEALGLFRGEPLADVDSQNLVPTWRRELARERLEATVARVELDLASGAGTDVVAELERLLDVHPYDERIWGQLMIALSRSGRQADALEVYQRVRRLFSYELGIQPGEPLARLQARLLAGEAIGPEAAPPVAEPEPEPEPEPERAFGQIPRPLGPLIGRASELADLAAAIAEPELRVLTLVGPGGVGKTRLALELAHRHETEFADGALLVRLEQLDDPALVSTEIAAAIGRQDGRRPPAADRLGEALAGRELLLVLDNFEHLLGAAADVGALLAGAPSVRVVATSRAPLRVRGERLFELEPLALPANDDESDASASPAVELFVALTTASDRRLKVDAELLRSAAVICRRLDGLPLAIELAAAQLRVLTPAQIEASLERPLDLGRRAPRDLPSRQQTLTDTIRWSYDLLAPEAREVLLAAGIFRGGFTLAALDAVVGRPAQADLAELLDASLIRRDQDDRFNVLELVRAFALEELVGAGRLAELRGRHRAYFASLAEPVGALLDDGDPLGPLAVQLRPEHANLRSAFEDAMQDGDGPLALTLVRGMRSLWYAGWLRAEAQEAIDRVLQRFEIDAETELVLLRAGSFLDYVDADAVIQGSFTPRLAERAEELGDLPALSVAVCNLASLAANIQDRDAVAELKPRLLALSEADIPARHLSFVYYNLAMACYLEDDVDAALTHIGEAVRQAASVDHGYALGSAVALRVMLSSIRDGEIRRADLAEALATIGRAAVRPLAIVAIWLVARYAAEVDRDASIRFMLAAEQLFVRLDIQIWPEDDLRAQTLAVLSLDGLTVDVRAPEPDFMATLASAVEWLSERDPSEVAVQLGVGRGG